MNRNFHTPTFNIYKINKKKIILFINLDTRNTFYNLTYYYYKNKNLYLLQKYIFFYC